MSYLCQYLQFGDNVKAVPGHNELTLDASESVVPVYDHLVDKYTHEIWDLSFSYRIDSNGAVYYPAGKEIPGGEHVTVKAWYIKQVPNGQHHTFTLCGFVTSKKDARFLTNVPIASFSEPGAIDNSIITDSISHPTVTADIIEKLGLTSVWGHSSNDGLLFKLTSTEFNEVKLLLPGEGTIVHADKITVRKGQGCLALIAYKEVISSFFKKIQTAPNTELIPEIGIEILEKLSGKEMNIAGSELSFTMAIRKDPKVIDRIIDSVLKKPEPVHH